ncbi:hypothetical protein HQ545_07660 [Candidatus Woesearchaeota archaeon]|nr:hypothetical protein [Candidatus Woesearchaeota archaeon]
MLSPFLKKLIFVRKFFIIDGQIEILGERQMLLPFTAIELLQNEQTFSIVSGEVQKTMANYARKIGASSGGMIKSVQDIYETMGLGKMRIIKLDTDNKKTVVRIEKINIKNTDLIGGVLCGLFSFMFDKDFSKENITITKKIGFFDVSIK